MTGRVAALSVLLFPFAVTPAFAQEAEEPGRASETCAEMRLDGDFHLKIPCPPGTRRLLQQLPRPAEPAPRRDIVIDPEWPHDQAMIAEYDWPYDWAMVAPLADAEEEAVPLLDELLERFGPFLSGSPQEDGGQGGWYFEREFDEIAK